MKIWIDADACPNVIKEILFRMAERTQISITLVANQWIKKPQSEFIHFIQVADGPDIADDEIVELCSAGDLIITADIPLAARVVDKGAFALDPRGTLYDQSNVGQALSMRDFMDSLRGSGVETGGPDSFHQRDRQAFANALDKFIIQKGRKG
ncbi:MAG: YaiI/YqxD family protein [Pseudomonadota bacterium]